MRRAAAATIVRLSWQASQDVAGVTRVAALAPSAFSLAAAEEPRMQGGQPKRSRSFGAHLAAALHLASVQQAGALCIHLLTSAVLPLGRMPPCLAS